MPNITKIPDFFTGDSFTPTKWPDKSSYCQRWLHISNLTLLGCLTNDNSTINITATLAYFKKGITQ